MSAAVLTVRLAADDRTVAFDIPLEADQMKRLTGYHGFRRDEVLDHLVRLTFTKLDIALRTNTTEGAGSARDE